MAKMKNALLAKEEQPKASPPATVSGNNPYAEVAAEGQTIGTLLKYAKGKWKIGDTQVKEGTEYIAHLPQALRGWIKFEGNKVVDRKIGKIAERFPMPEREELGDTDPAKWEKDAGGQPRDPWVKQYYLP